MKFFSQTSLTIHYTICRKIHFNSNTVHGIKWPINENRGHLAQTLVESTNNHITLIYSIKICNLH